MINLNRLLLLVVLSSMSAHFVHAETVSPRRLLEVVDIDQPVVSPDGNAVAFRTEQASIERNTYDTSWYVQRIDGTSPPVRVADGGVPLRDSAGISLPAVASWSSDGRWIYYRALVEGRIGIWRAATDGSSAEQVTDDPADVRDFALSADGRFLKYSVGATREEVEDAEETEYDQGIHVDERVPIGQGLYRSGFIEGHLATQRFDKVWFDRTSLLADEPAHWKMVDLGTSTTRNLVASEAPVSPLIATDLAKRHPDVWKLAREPGGSRVALLTRTGDGEGLLYKPDVQLSVLSVNGAEHARKCHEELCVGKPLSGVQWRPNSDEVLFTVTDPMQGDSQSILDWNVRNGVVRLITRSRGLINGGRDSSSGCGASVDTLVCVVATPERPPRLESVDVETGWRFVLFDPNAALAQDMALVPPRLLRWTDESGETFTGQLFEAPRSGGMAPPLFVTYYRCAGFVRGGVGDEWPLASLAENGISALCINAAPYRIAAVDRYNEGLSAIESAIQLLASRNEVDRGKVGMGGLSFGTEETLWMLMHSDSLAAASISSPGISQQYYLLGSIRGNTFFSGLREYWQAGSPAETPEQWRELSPALNLANFHAPVLMQLPEQEYMHTLDYAIPLIHAHRADLYVFPNEPHQKFQPRHKLAVYERNLDWFRFWLLGDEDESPEKRGQYATWQLMRDHASKPSKRGRNSN